MSRSEIVWALLKLFVTIAIKVARSPKDTAALLKEIEYVTSSWDDAKTREEMLAAARARAELGRKL